MTEEEKKMTTEEWQESVAEEVVGRGDTACGTLTDPGYSDDGKGEKKKQKLPAAKWFKNNGTPLKKVKVTEKQLGNAAEEDLNVIALSTHASVGKVITLMGVLVGVLVVLILFMLKHLSSYVFLSVEKLLFWIEALQDLSDLRNLLWLTFFYEFYLHAGGFLELIIVVGSFFMPGCYKVLKGFLRVNGAERLGLSRGYRRAIKFFCKLSYVWGILYIAIGALVRRIRHKKSVIQVVIPENCGYENLFAVETAGSAHGSSVGQDNGKREELRALAQSYVYEDWHAIVDIVDELPSAGWYKDNGTPVKEINIHPQVLLKMSHEELNLVAATTFALVRRRVKLISALLWLMGIGIAIALFGLASMKGLSFIFIMMGIGIFAWSIFWGLFLMPSCNTLLEGFDFIYGAERLGLSKGYKTKLKVYRKISAVWGWLGIFVLLLFGGDKNSNLEWLPHVGMPRNCGYDSMIDVYLKLEQASVADVTNALQKTWLEKEYAEFKEKLKDISGEIKSDKVLTDDDKEILQRKLKEKKEKGKKKHGEEKSKLDEQWEQEIQPIYDSANSEIDELTEEGSTQMPIDAQVLYAQVNTQGGKPRQVKKKIGATVKSFAMHVRKNPLSFGLAVAAVVCFLVGIIVLGVKFESERIEDMAYISGAAFIPFLLACLFAVAGMVVHFKTDNSIVYNIISIAVLVLAVLYTYYFGMWIIDYRQFLKQYAR